jgi:hypothetical protein
VSKAKALRITFVQYEGGYSLLIGWINGESRSVSLTGQVLRLRAMRSLRNKAVFAQAGTGEGGTALLGLAASIWARTAFGKSRRRRTGGRMLSPLHQRDGRSSL